MGHNIKFLNVFLKLDLELFEICNDALVKVLFQRSFIYKVAK